MFCGSNCNNFSIQKIIETFDNLKILHCANCNLTHNTYWPKKY